MSANEALKRTFPYNLLNASGTVEHVKEVVMQELAYQSSLELAEAAVLGRSPVGGGLGPQGVEPQGDGAGSSSVLRHA